MDTEALLSNMTLQTESPYFNKTLGMHFNMVRYSATEMLLEIMCVQTPENSKESENLIKTHCTGKQLNCFSLQFDHDVISSDVVRKYNCGNSSCKRCTFLF